MAPLHLVATATVQDGKLQDVRRSFHYCRMKPDQMSQALDAIKTLTEEAQKNEPGLLRYFAFTTKNEEGQDQIVFVEKYIHSHQHALH